MKKIEPQKIGNRLPSYMLITYLIKEVFGTYFIEPLDWKFPVDCKTIGRTFFADRKKHKCAVNERTLENILLIYRLALGGQSTYDAQRVSQELTKTIKEHFRLNIDYLMYFDDDTPELRKQKYTLLNHMVYSIAGDCRGKEYFDTEDYIGIHRLSEFKMKASIIRYAIGTYTEIVLQNLHLTDPN
ncbi:MAG: hypothetical protein E7437_00210 [Ruminococcaceae bacterium]|nr:hypothetical protein [Oscillospiraceae bacterium]